MELFNHFLDLVTSLSIFRSWDSILDHFLLCFHFIFFFFSTYSLCWQLLMQPTMSRMLWPLPIALVSVFIRLALSEGLHLQKPSFSFQRLDHFFPSLTRTPCPQLCSPTEFQLILLVFLSVHCFFLSEAFAGQPATSGPAVIGPHGLICFSFGVASFD